MPLAGVGRRGRLMKPGARQCLCRLTSWINQQVHVLRHQHESHESEVVIGDGSIDRPAQKVSPVVPHEELRTFVAGKGQLMKVAGLVMMLDPFSMWLHESALYRTNRSESRVEDCERITPSTTNAGCPGVPLAAALGRQCRCRLVREPRHWRAKAPACTRYVTLVNLLSERKTLAGQAPASGTRRKE